MVNFDGEAESVGWFSVRQLASEMTNEKQGMTFITFFAKCLTQQTKSL